MNAFCCEERIVLCFELAGVEKESIDLVAEPRRLRVRGVRPPPEPPQCDGPFAQILALEIDHGAFEREITLPTEIDPEGVRAEQRNGLLWVQLPVRR